MKTLANTPPLIWLKPFAEEGISCSVAYFWETHSSRAGAMGILAHLYYVLVETTFHYAPGMLG